MNPDIALAQADAAVATAARTLDAATARARAARYEANRADQQAAAAYRAWAGASSHRSRLVAQRLTAPGAGGSTVRPGGAGSGAAGPGAEAFGAAGPGYVAPDAASASPRAAGPGLTAPVYAGPGHVPPWVGPVGEPVRAETSAWSVQTVLLALGGVLLAVAAVVFTVVAWGAFGIGGRAAILAGITAITFAVPALLDRRGLASTAETIGLLGLVLVALDGYALHHVGLVPWGGPRYAGTVLGAVTAVALLYPLLVPLRTLRPAGLVLAHPAVILLFSPPLDAVAASAALGLALVGTDLAVRRYARDTTLRATATISGAITSVVTLLCALIAAAAPSDAPIQRLVGTLALFGLAAAALLAAETVPHPAPMPPRVEVDAGAGAPALPVRSVQTGRAVAQGLAAGIAVPLVLAGPMTQWLRFGPEGWGLTGLAVAIALAAATPLALRTPWRTGTSIASAALAALAALSPAAAVGFTLLAPLVSPELVWNADSITQPVWAVPDTRPHPDLVTALLALTAATVLLLLSRNRPTRHPAAATTPVGAGVARQAATTAAPLGVGAVVVLAPAAFGASIWATVLVVGLAGAVATVAGMLRRTPDAPLLSWLGGALVAHAAVVSLASRPATLVTLGAVAALYGAVAARSDGTRQVLATGIALGTLSGWAAALATAFTSGAQGWSGGPGPAGVAVGLSALVALAVARLTRETRPPSATLAAILAGVTAYVGAALAVTHPAPAGVLHLIDRPLIAVLALTAAALAATATRAALPHRTAAPSPDAPLATAVPVEDASRSRKATDAARSGTSDAAGERWGSVAAAAPGVIVAALVLAPAVLAVVFGPLSWVSAVWRGAPVDAAQLGPALPYPGTVLDSIVLLVAAGALLGVRWRADRRTALWFAVPALAPGIATLAPALHAPWPVALTVLLALAATGTVLASLPARRPVGAGLAAVAGLTAVAWALADRAATLVVLGVVLVAAAAVTALTRENAPRSVGAATAAVSAVALAFAVGAAADLPTAYLLVAVATALVVPGIFAVPRVITDVLDAGAAVAGTLAFASAGVLALDSAADSAINSAGSALDQPVFALTATLLGIPLGLAGLRATRRWCVWLVPGMELVALWAWLGRAGVTVPEAYTLPAAAVVAAFGLYTLRRRPAVSSWLALGPALTVAAVPTLAVALSAGTLGLRVLLLGLAALTVTLAGAATRRQAPFLFGATVLSLVTARALAPVLPALADTVPTWVPLSLAGALLLAVGATYERRRRDATRLAAYLRTMR
ncbi:SCO7613 C-terminal domain-containing membrane protein [Cryptosporangium sp. NPDC048952]|uniref:SCO7613 C-terminal domain-containing membrane protein n=1 Tax=Cryptosporangium sp. NPDC048952 TaxID=3363961 RepID=UPI00371E0935